jgi:catechol 2,3-dioxygenase-like lactoylglutathione lyase family enzyme
MPYLSHISLLVRDYDEAIAFYTNLGFQLVEDTVIPSQQKRWVTIRPPPSPPPAPQSTTTSTDTPQQQDSQTTILLARPSNAEQEKFIGDQAGGRVFLFLATDDFERDYKRFSDRGVEWVRPPVDQGYGRVAVWRDLYGNLWDLIQYK